MTDTNTDKLWGEGRCKIFITAFPLFLILANTPAGGTDALQILSPTIGHRPIVSAPFF